MTDKVMQANDIAHQAQTGAMIAFFLPAEFATIYGGFARDAGLPAESPDDLHITLAFLGEAALLAEQKPAIVQLLRDFAAGASPLTGSISGIGRFNTSGDQDPLYASFDAPALPAFRQALVDVLAASGVLVASDHGFTPHITLAYLEPGAPMPDLIMPPTTITFDKITLAWGDERIELPLSGPVAEKSAEDAFASEYLVALTDVERARWREIYEAALTETGDPLAAKLAADGAIFKAQIIGMKSAGDEEVIAGWAILFTDADHLDIAAVPTYFDELTELMLEYYPKAPLFYEHGEDPAYGLSPIGQRASVKAYPRGVWVEHSLHRDHPQYPRTKSEAQSGLLAYSSDSMDHLIIKGWNPVDGRLDFWPFSGCSVTRRPAEPALGPVVLKQFVQALKSATSERREAEGESAGSPVNSKSASSKQEGSMNEEMLKALAEFLGVEATPEAVQQGMQAYMAEFEGMATVPPELAAALGLDANADKAAVMSRLQQMAQMAAPAAAMSADEEDDDEEEPPAKKSYAALSRAFGAASKATSNDGGIPYRTREPGAKKSRSYGGFGVNRGAPKPGLIEMFRSMKYPHLAAAKAQSYAIGPTGGFLLNHELSNEIIPVLRAAIPLFDMGVDFYPMEGTETLTLPKEKTEHSAYWVGEGTEIPESQETLGGIMLYPRPLAARVIIPNKFLANTTVNYEQRVREKVSYQIRNAIMYAALFGTGGITGSNTGAQPRGLVNITGVTNTALATNGAKPKPKDMSDCVGRVEDDNVETNDSWSWLMSPRTVRTFKQMTDTTGQPLYRERWNDGGDPVIEGYPVNKSTVIPNNATQGSSSAASHIFFGSWVEMALAMSNQFEFLIDPYSRSSSLNTVIIAYTYADVVIKHEESFEVLTGVIA